VFTFWQEVVYFKVPPLGQPGLTAETIDASKGEFVAEPIPVLAIFGITQRPVPTNVWL
jgi:hypothetical protein